MRTSIVCVCLCVCVLRNIRYGSTITKFLVQEIFVKNVDVAVDGGENFQEVPGHFGGELFVDSVTVH